MMKKLLSFTFSRLVFGLVLPRNLRKKVHNIPGLSEAAVAALVVLPYAEEFWRCYRVDHTLDAHPVITQHD
jgi:hypothetical protein